MHTAHPTRAVAGYWKQFDKSAAQATRKKRFHVTLRSVLCIHCSKIIQYHPEEFGHLAKLKDCALYMLYMHLILAI